MFLKIKNPYVDAKIYILFKVYIVLSLNGPKVQFLFNLKFIGFAILYVKSHTIFAALFVYVTKN